MDHGSYFLLSLTLLTVTRSFSETTVYVTTAVGYDCVLWCFGLKDLQVSVLEWTRPEQNKDLFAVRGGKILDGYEHPDYTNRVELLKPLLDEEYLSVVLKKVTLEDTGTYRCEAVYEDGQEISQSIHLTVTETVSVTVPEGQDCELPCSSFRDQKVTNLLWSYSNQRKPLLGFKEWLRSHIHRHPQYSDRAELKDPQLHSTDLSLVLKKVTVQDSGTYECMAEYRDEEIYQRSFHYIHLIVTDPEQDETWTIFGLSTGAVLGLGLVCAIVYVGLTNVQFFLNIVSHFKASKKRSFSFSTPSQPSEVSTQQRSDSETLRVRVI